GVWRRAPLPGVRGDGVVVLRGGPRRQRARSQPAAGGVRVGRDVRRDRGARHLVPASLADHPELALPPPCHGGGRGGPRRLDAAHLRTRRPSLRRTRRPVLLLAIPEARLLVHVASVL